MTYEACYLPGDESYNDPSKGGFKTEEDAYDYIDGYLKKNKCRVTGCIECESCSAEWMVFEEE